MSFDLSLLRDSGISWLDASGPESGIVLSTRVRLARNLQGLPFTIRTREDDRAAILEQVLGAVRLLRSCSQGLPGDRKAGMSSLLRHV